MITAVVPVFTVLLAAAPTEPHQAALGGSQAVITFQLKTGVVRFPHASHIERLKQDCAACHGLGARGTISGFGKDAAHQLCKGCHEQVRKGPVLCIGCHGRSQDQGPLCSPNCESADAASIERAKVPAAPPVPTDRSGGGAVQAAEVSYDVVQSAGGQRLQVRIGSRTIDGPEAWAVTVEAVEDFDGDGVPDALVTANGGGNGNPPDRMVVSVAQGHLVLVELPWSWEGYTVETLEGRKVLHAKSTGGTSYLAIQKGAAKQVKFVPPLTAVAEMFGVGAHYSGPDETKLLQVDLDGDGKPDLITCGIWPRWGSLVGCESTLRGVTHFLTPSGYGCDRIGILDARRNGFRKLVCNNDTIFSFNGKTWEMEPTAP